MSSPCHSEAHAGPLATCWESLPLPLRELAAADCSWEPLWFQILLPPERKASLLMHSELTGLRGTSLESLDPPQRLTQEPSRSKASRLKYPCAGPYLEANLIKGTVSLIEKE